MAIAFILFSVFCGAFGQIALKHGMNKLGRTERIRHLAKVSNLVRMFTHPYVLLGVLFYAMSSIVWLGLLSQLEVSFLYPLVSLGYIITTIFAIGFLKEKVSLQRWLGTLIVVLGSSLILLS
jgi:drug/metabolite transporter (DMT)-like permease